MAAQRTPKFRRHISGQKASLSRSARRRFLLSSQLAPQPEPHPNHFVQFYKADEPSFLRKLNRFVADGLTQGDAVLVIAQPKHRDALNAQLKTAGLNANSYLAQRQLAFVDSKDLLERYLVDGSPNWNRFEPAVTQLIDAVQPSSPGAGRRAYGDMVGLLWNAQQYDAAIAVERFWNRLMAGHSFQLFCGYPIDIFDPKEQAPHLERIAREHNHVLTADESGDIEKSISRAAREVLGPESDRYKAFEKATASISANGWPSPEARIKWIRHEYPENAPEILTRARGYYPAQRRFAAMVENSADGIALLDVAGSILYASPGAAAILGGAPKELVGKNGLALVHPEDCHNVEQSLRNALSEPGRAFKMEARVFRGGESPDPAPAAWVWIEITFSNLPDPLEPGAVIANFHDITQRKHDQEALRDAGLQLAARERYLFTVLDSLPECIKVLGPSGELLDMNAAGLRIIEAENLEQVRNTCIYSLIDEKDRLAFRQLNESIFQGGTGGKLEFGIRGLKGAHFSLEMQVVPLKNGADEIIGSLSITRNVTEQKQAEIAPRRLAAIVESSEDAILSKDLNGLITSWNAAAERMFGYTADEMIGKPISTLAPPDRVSEAPAILARIRRGERIENFETIRQRKDGQTIAVSLTVSPIRDDTGKIVGVSKIARDITARQRTEAALKESNEALRRANADLEQFAYAAAHDLQEPLRTVAIYAQKLERQTADSLSPAAASSMQFVMQGARQMEQLVRDLLTYTRAIASPVLEDSAADANNALKMALLNLQSSIDESGARISCEALPHVRLAEGPLVQLFQNILGNSLKYRGANPPEIAVYANQQGRQSRICVRDNGIGIAPEYQKHIFGLFKRLHHRDKYPGTGIGLALCQRIVERAGGQIWVESEGEGKGSTFCFTLPT